MIDDDCSIVVEAIGSADAIILADIRQTQVVYGALPGEIVLDDGNRKAARTLAQSLFGPKVPKTGPCCPLCGGDTFRFMGPDKVRCMLCSNAGSIHMENGTAVVEIKMADHQPFLTRQDVKNHKSWLMGMKDRFMTMRKTLKPISVDYLKDGQWIKPHTNT